MSNKAFGDLWTPWGSSVEVTGFLVAIWVGPQIKVFFWKFFDFFVRKIGPLLGTCLNQTWVRLKIFLIRFNLVSERLDLTQLMTHKGFAGIDSNQLMTQNGFLEIDSNRLMTQGTSKTF